jgi:uncharacterized protein (DUF2164 family)
MFAAILWEDIMINITKDERNRYIEKIVGFFENERDEEIGIIAAESVLDFFLEDIGNGIYNKALNDARKWFTEKMDDANIDFNQLYK